MMHAIGKQILDFRFDASVDSFQMQHELSQAYWKKIVPELEIVFDQYATKQQIVQIDRLVIDLGHLLPSQILSGTFIDNLRKEIQSQLENILSQSAAQKAEIVSIEESAFQQWAYFLEYGRLPWMSLQRGPAWHTKVLEVLATQVKAVEATQKLLRSQPIALQRLVWQHETSFLQAVAAIFTRIKQDELHAAITELGRFTTTYATFIASEQNLPIDSRSLELFFWKEILEAIIVLGKKEGTLRLIRRILGTYFPPLLLLQEQQSKDKTEFPMIQASLWLDSTSEGNSSWKETLSTPQKGSPRDGQMPLRKEDLSIEKSPLTDSNPPKIHSPSSDSLSKDLDQEAEKQADRSVQKWTPIPSKLDFSYEYDRKDVYLQERPQLKKENLYINNAGLVLLHPFLRTYFDTVGLIKDGDFRSESARHRAIHLLHFLGSGNLTQIPEYELILPKILCGLPLGLPIDHQIEISTIEQQEGETLLQAAIDHWAALKSAKPAGLREGFLLREGKLLLNDQGWQLQVERKTIDILLDQLPWGVGIIKLPWMLEMLFVEWT